MKFLLPPCGVKCKQVCTRRVLEELSRAHEDKAKRTCDLRNLSLNNVKVVSFHFICVRR